MTQTNRLDFQPRCRVSEKGFLNTMFHIDANFVVSKTTDSGSTLQWDQILTLCTFSSALFWAHQNTDSFKFHLNFTLAQNCITILSFSLVRCLYGTLCIVSLTETSQKVWLCQTVCLPLIGLNKMVTIAAQTFHSMIMKLTWLRVTMIPKG